MIGNDIIDLKLAQKKHILRPRFMAKVFTKPEQELIFLSAQPIETAWLLWSMKESAYKLYVQKGGTRRFIPIHFCGRLFSKQHGSIQHAGTWYFITFEITRNYIISQATLNSRSKAIQTPYHFKNVDHLSQKTELRSYLKKELSSRYGIKVEDMAVKKNTNAVPQVYFHSKKQTISLSLSHHGRYGAVVYIDSNLN